MSLSNVLTLNNVTLQREDIVLCERVNADIVGGSVVHVLGGNGTGKTTLLMMLAGLLPVIQNNVDTALVWNNTTPEEWSSVFIGHKLGLDMQLSVQHNLVFLTQLQCASIKGTLSLSFDTKQMIRKALQKVGLQGYEDDMCSTLSAGQKQRIQLSRLWFEILFFEQYLLSSSEQQATEVAHQRLWILDEPFTALDNQMIESLQQLFIKFNSFGGRIVMSSHQPLHIQTHQLDLTPFIHQYKQSQMLVSTKDEDEIV